MKDAAWKRLTKRFPRVPSRLKIETKAKARIEQPVTALAFSPDGRRLAVSGGGLLPGPADVHVFDVATRKHLYVGRAHSMGVFALAFDPRTGLLASASHDYAVILWDFERRDAIHVGDPEAAVSRRAVAFTGARLLVADGMTWGDARATLTAIDLESGKREVLMKLRKNLGVEALVVGDEIAVAIGNPREGSSGGGIRLLRIDGRERMHIEPNLSVHAMSWAKNRLVVAATTASDDNELVVFDRKTGKRRATRVIKDGARLSVQGDEIAVANGNAVEICAIETLAPEQRIDLGSERACSVAWSHGCLAVGTAQSTLRFFAR